LIKEKSPYLLQHAHNPVDWFPWGDEAFTKARTENKPIFLSVGYSTCHWCHRMAHESFENEEIAAILNAGFVPIKVDREERPDIDKMYMAFVHALSGGGGWPMSVWLTPDLRPFYGGLYYPPDDLPGNPGLKGILLLIDKEWKRNKVGLVESGDQFIRELRKPAPVQTGTSQRPDRSTLDLAYGIFKDSFDPMFGGFGDAPKFPNPSILLFMLRYHAATGVPDALDMVLFTIRKMADGGIHDHLGGGFHRYSVDRQWQVPHFEKMLYDQAQLACICIDAYQITRNRFFAETARDILGYVRRDMTGELGQFLSAEDADSPAPGDVGKHAEGAFYVWEQGEIAAVLGPTEAAIVDFYYGIGQNGNVSSDVPGELAGKNILARARSIDETSAHFGKTNREIELALTNALRRLYEVRAERPRPHRDDKCITAWNGLMISAFARAGQVLEDETYLTSAKTAADFIRRRLYDETAGDLLRRYRDGESAIEGYCDDYAFLVQGLLDLYESCFDADYLVWAIDLQGRQDALFRDDDSGGYFSTTGKDETVLLRMKEDYDGAEPSPNSVALLNLLRLAQMTGNADYDKKADTLLIAFNRVLTKVPQALPRMAAALIFLLDKPKQIIIAGRAGAPDTLALLADIHSRFMPNKILLLVDGRGGPDALVKEIPYLKTFTLIDNKATAYVCENHSCQIPTNDLRTMAGILTGKT
jgi:hypothetical protein